jgi:hypothetical protein
VRVDDVGVQLQRCPHVVAETFGGHVGVRPVARLDVDELRRKQAPSRPSRGLLRALPVGADLYVLRIPHQAPAAQPTPLPLTAER